MNDDEEKGYSWETEYERTWEGIREDEHGLVSSSVEDIIHKAKRRFVTFRTILFRCICEAEGSKAEAVLLFKQLFGEDFNSVD